MERALITGATSGIGRAMALRLAKAGYEVVAIGRSRAALAELAAAAPGLTPLALDVTDAAAVEAALAGQRIDVLVNNAGAATAPAPFDASDMGGMARLVEVNLSAVLRLTRIAVPQMRARGAGHLVFTSSTAAHQPAAGMAVYSATKAAVSAFATALRAELAADGVRVTEIVPGRVETGLYRTALDDASRAAMYADDLSVQPEDVAEALAAALALPARASVTRFDILPTRPVPPLGAK